MSGPNPADMRRQILGWSIRRDDALAARAREQGWWLDTTIASAAAKLAEAEPDRIVVMAGTGLSLLKTSNVHKVPRSSNIGPISCMNDSVVLTVLLPVRNETMNLRVMLRILRAVLVAPRVLGGGDGDGPQQVGAAQHYVDLALKTMPLIYVELAPGDALFFHSNLLHRSEANLSDKARWSLISCYNRQDNIGYNEPNGSHKVPVKIVPDEALMEWQTSGVMDSASFLEKDKDQALK